MGGSVCSLCADDEDYISTSRPAIVCEKEPLRKGTVMVSPDIFVLKKESDISKEYTNIEQIGEGNQ